MYNVYKCHILNTLMACTNCQPASQPVTSACCYCRCHHHLGVVNGDIVIIIRVASSTKDGIINTPTHTNTLTHSDDKKDPAKFSYKTFK